MRSSQLLVRHTESDPVTFGAAKVLGTGGVLLVCRATSLPPSMLRCPRFADSLA